MDELRETIARAIYENEVAHMVKHSTIPESNILTWDQMADHPHREVYTTNADAVIAALGLTEERHPGATWLLDDSVWTRPDNRRYVTVWEETP